MVKITIPNFCINFLNKTEKSLPILCDFAVTSLADAWIKIFYIKMKVPLPEVTSLADAWIKMSKPIIAKKTFLSHPSWVRGLKYEVSISWIT